jgi:outer membrane lipoprotein-sorting protein
MWSLLLCAALSSVPDSGLSLDALAATVRSAPAWRATFVQRYLPEGFSSGTTDKGTLLLVSPNRLRFDYAPPNPRIFAVDGSLARLVDTTAGSCEAVRLDTTQWGRLPLAALLDPGAAHGTFTITIRGRTMHLVPREPLPELADVELTVGDDGMPTSVVAIDAGGNRNEFTFSDWRAARAPDPQAFQPSLPGAPPCVPEQR